MPMVMALKMSSCFGMCAPRTARTISGSIFLSKQKRKGSTRSQNRGLWEVHRCLRESVLPGLISIAPGMIEDAGAKRLWIEASEMV